MGTKYINDISKAQSDSEVKYLLGVDNEGNAKLMSRDGVFIIDASDDDYATSAWITALQTALVGGKTVYVYANGFTGGSSNLGKYYCAVQGFSYNENALDIIYNDYGIQNVNVDSPSAPYATSQIRCLRFTLSE